ncbi:VENN motif pre-toxin domain-containing protein [Rahnella sp. L72c]|uniref:VENN motif pre-toxin domain-containing protein n=1 Tax=Rahnella perminowiae TaxID=2816244 RepID=A0ABS6KYR8_9GAMM|nr:VENN motif pre-toxin domain-containing protein [Rahnella perminowiae]
MDVVMTPTSWLIAVMGGKAIITNTVNNTKEQLIAVGVGAGLGAGIQYGTTGKVNLSDLIGAGVIGAITAGKGYNPVMTWNMAGGYYQAEIKGDDPFMAALGFSDIHNSTEYEVEHQSVGISSGGNIGGQFVGNMANGLLVGVNGSGSDSSMTKAAVSDGTITIRDRDNLKQDVGGLSRDVEHANQTLSPIFDKEKEQNRLKEAQLIGEIGVQVGDIARTQGQIIATKAANDKMKGVTPDQLKTAEAEWRKANPGKEPATDDISSQAYQNFYNQAFTDSGFGTGGKVQQALQAATAAVQGLAGGDIAKAAAGGAAPYIANIIGSSGLDDAGKVLAHAAVNAALAAAQGNNALVGAAGAATAEMMGMIALNAYGKPVSELSETEKQTVSALATLAAGLAGGLTGDSTADAVAGAQAGKTTVENNLLGGSEDAQAAWIRQHGIDMASCADAPGSASCQKAMNERDAVGLALATGSVALLPGGAQAMWGLGAGANAGIGYLADGTIDPANAAIAGWVNVISMGNGLAGTVGWNAAGGALGNWIDDKDPLSGALINGAGSGIGYGIGKGLSWGVNAGANWWKGGWDPKFNPTLQKFTDIKGEFGLSKEITPSNVPSPFGDLGGSVFSEVTGKGIEKISSPSSNGDKK